MRINPRWIAPVAAAGVVAAVSGVAATTSASAGVKLTPKSTAQIVALAARASQPAWSGSIRESADLGLPALPGQSSSGSGTSLADLSSGTHTMRVWSDGPQRSRVQIEGQLSSSTLVRDNNSVWTYSSSTNRATHLMLPSHSAMPQSTLEKGAPSTPRTPEQLARTLLKSLDPSTKVTTGTPTSVAGRPSYRLVLTPRVATSLVRHIDIAVDSSSGLPLQVQVFAKGVAAPAIDVAVTALDLHAPDASRFTFSAPKGATVTNRALTMPTKAQLKADQNSHSPNAKVVGKGWGSALALPAGSIDHLTAGSGATPGNPRSAHRGTNSLQSVLSGATKVPGGRVISTHLVTVLIKDNGAVYVGALTPAALQALASS